LKKSRLLTQIISFLLLAQSAHAIDIDRPEVQQFVDAMVTDYDYDRATLEAVLRGAESQQTILDAISRPAEKTLTWPEYRAIFMTEQRISAGATFWRDNEASLKRISSDTGVPCEILVGIIGVETYFGRNTGKYRVIDALTTLAFDYPPRASFFRKELQQFLLLIREEGMAAADATGSYAGAMGRPQFMPSSYRAYAVDSSTDGKRDIWDNWDDVIGSVANYFVRHDWQAGGQVVAEAKLTKPWDGKPPKNMLTPEETVQSLDRKGVEFPTDLPANAKTQLIALDGPDGEQYWVGFHNFFVITRYNRSVMYALAVHQLGQAIAQEIRDSAS
jgi:membrane-bound lytic murein transglycosylase B